MGTLGSPEIKMNIWGKRLSKLGHWEMLNHSYILFHPDHWKTSRCISPKSLSETEHVSLSNIHVTTG